VRDPDRVLLAAIAHRISDPGFGTGSLASLRRGDPASVIHQPAFHRLVLDLDDAALGESGALRWATAILLLATLTEPGADPSLVGTGAALASAGFPESRLARLLASRGDAFRDQAVLAARFLRGRHVPCRPLDLAELSLVEERAERRAERLRFRLARDYYGVLDAGHTL
jgi:CRISPR type I-E-associated protein CasB/Cse2